MSKRGFSVGSDTRSPCWIYNLGYTRSDLTSLFSIKLLSIDFKLDQISWTSYGYFGRRKDPQCRKQKGNWSNIIRDKVAASILLKTKSAVKLCYEKLFGDKLHHADFQVHRYFNVPLRLYIIYLFICIFLTVYLPHRCICWLKSTSLQPTALLLNVILKYNPPSILLHLHMLFCGDISDRFSFLPDINC